MRIFSSFVDNRPDFIAEAEMLSWSLVHWAKVEPQNIFLQLAPGIKPAQLPVAKSMGVNFPRATHWPASSDDPESLVYCNKIMQLADGVLPPSGDVTLLDCDVLATRPLPPAPRGVSGRIADVNAIPLANFERLFRLSGLELPKIVKADTGRGRVPFGWFNGGVLNISCEFREALAESWPRWVRWILESTSDPFVLRFIDEVAFCLATVDTGTPVTRLDRTMNFSVHLEKPFWKDRDPILIHYRGHFAKRGVLRFVPRKKVLSLNYALLSNRRISWINQNLEQFRRSIPDHNGVQPNQSSRATQ